MSAIGHLVAPECRAEVWGKRTVKTASLLNLWPLPMPPKSPNLWQGKSRPQRVRSQGLVPDQGETPESERSRGTEAKVSQLRGRSWETFALLSLAWSTCKRVSAMAGTSRAANFCLLSFLCWTLQPSLSLFFSIFSASEVNWLILYIYSISSKIWKTILKRAISFNEAS